MQSIVNAASNALNTATAAASSAATTAASYTGLTSPTVTTGSTITTGQDGHNEEHKTPALPVDATAGEVKKMDAEGLAVFEDKEVRHEILVKINQLALDDKKHGLKELAALELVTDSGKKGIDFYHPQVYMIVTRPMGMDYIGEVEIEDGKCIHIRCHKASATAAPRFHSIDTRPGDEGGAVFKTGEPLRWFDY